MNGLYINYKGKITNVERVKKELRSEASVKSEALKDDYIHGRSSLSSIDVIKQEEENSKQLKIELDGIKGITPKQLLYDMTQGRKYNDDDLQNMQHLFHD